MVLKTNLQNYNKILKVSIKMAKKYYYHSCLHNVKGNIKKSWSTINDILCKKGKKTNFPVFFKIDDNIINNNTSIANKFNDFFTTIGSKLASEIQTSPHRKFSDFLGNDHDSNFTFKWMILIKS